MEFPDDVGVTNGVLNVGIPNNLDEKLTCLLLLANLVKKVKDEMTYKVDEHFALQFGLQSIVVEPCCIIHDHFALMPELSLEDSSKENSLLSQFQP